MRLSLSDKVLSWVSPHNSKVNPIETNSTRRPEDFAELQLKAFKDNGVVDRVTYQSFDWRTLKLSKKMLPELKTSALAA